MNHMKPNHPPHKLSKLAASTIFMAAALLALPAWAQTVTVKTGNAADISNSYDGKVDKDRALAVSQAAIGRVVGDYSFLDTHGNKIKLSDYRGKPLVISFVYSSCSDVCPVIIKTLENADEVARDALGEDAYAMITVGFDVASDTPTRMQSFARKYRIPLSDHWRFVSGELGAILGLSDDTGFIFFRSPKGFDHLTQTTILDKDGRVHRQIYGEAFETPHFVDPLKNLVFGTTTPYASIDDFIKKVRLFCTIYDPVVDKYHFEYAIFFRLIVGAVILLAMATFLVRWTWNNYRHPPGGGDKPV